MNIPEIIQCIQTAVWILFLAWLALILKRANWRELTTVKPVFLDGGLWVIIAMGQAAQARLGSEDVYKYVEPHMLYWLKTGVEIVTQGATGLKMFRSTAYGKHLAEEKNLQTVNETKPSTT